MSIFAANHTLSQRLAALVLAGLAGLSLSSCTTTSSQQARLPVPSASKPEAQSKVASAPVPVRLPAERVTDVRLATTGEPVTVEQPPLALDTPPPEQVASVLEQAQPATLDEMVMAPTAATANDNSIFASRQMAYSPETSPSPAANSTSLVPSNLPVRAGINPSVGSLFSAPKAAETYQAYAEPAAAAQPEPEAEQLVTPEPAAEVAYDPAEPVPEQATSGKKKSFSLMRMLGRKDG